MAKTQLSPLRVLVVDDNYHMLHTVRTILRGFGIEHIEEARDAAEAFEIFRQSPVDLIVVDYLMEILDGLDFVRLVRTAQDSPNPYVPVIMLTAYSEKRRVVEARDAGVTEFCCKPVTAKELLTKIKSVIETPRTFIRTKTYFGPDRRRRQDPAYSGPERRKANKATA